MKLMIFSVFKHKELDQLKETSLGVSYHIIHVNLFQIVDKKSRKMCSWRMIIIISIDGIKLKLCDYD